MTGNHFEYSVFQGEFLRVCQAIQRGACPEHRLRNEGAGEINPPLQAASRAAEGKAKETRIEREAAHNAALAC